MRVPTIVTNDVLFHAPDRRILQDVVTCIRHNVTIDELGERRERHADRYLKPPEEMHRLFGRYPEALARTLQIVERCRSEEHTSELQSLMRLSYAVFCLKKKTNTRTTRL